MFSGFLGASLSELFGVVESIYSKLLKICNLFSVDMYKLLIQNARQIVKVCEDGEICLVGDQLKSLATLETDNIAAGFSLVVDCSGKIAAIGRNDEVMNLFSSFEFQHKLDATGKCVLPGL